MLHKVIKRVGRFAPRIKTAPELFKAVRWIPASELPYLNQTEGSWVVAFDGVVGIACHVTEDLPDTLVPVDGLAQAVASPIVAVADQGVSVALEADSGGTFQIPKWDPKGYPSPPIFRGAYRLWDIWPLVQQVIHCTAGPKSMQPTFQHACLRPGGVEVTDGIAVAHAPGWGWDAQVLLPAKMLDPAPGAEPAELAIDDHHAVLRIGDSELRWGHVRRDMTFHDCAAAVASAENRGGHVLVNVKALREATRQAVSISVSSAVGCIFDGHCMALLGWRGAAHSTEHAYDVTLPISGGKPMAETVTVYLDGKLLARALRAVDTPLVEIGFSGEHEPLRLSWGAITELIWPWRL